MKSAQQIIPAFAVAVYLAIFVGGRVLHQHHCIASATDCCKESSETALDSSKAACLLGSAHKHAEDNQTSTHPSNNKQPKDRSADCWTCHFLAQVASSSHEIVLHPNIQFIYFVANDYDAWRLLSYTHNYLVRGPPETLLATS